VLQTLRKSASADDADALDSVGSRFSGGALAVPAFRMTIVMNMAFKKGVLWLLLMLGTASAFAWPDGAYSVQYRPYAQQRDFQDRRGQDGQGERRRRGDGDYQRQRRDAGEQDGGRRGRMTPDERRTLRRQINEAGRDLYPRR